MICTQTEVYRPERVNLDFNAIFIVIDDKYAKQLMSSS